jgi:3-deoxy-D-manno-octulosonic-acid transferase
MPYLLNFCYALLLVLLGPWLIYKALTAGKYRRGLVCKLLGLTPVRRGSRPCVWIHGVSVGEIHLLQQVVAGFRRRHAGWDCVISTTTDTGFEEARKRFPDLTVFFWPLDFTWAVGRALRRIRPDLIVLAEGELWPNFLALAGKKHIPVAVINGRMSPRSFRRHQRLRWLTRPLFRRLALCAVQTEDYAQLFRDVGVPPERIGVTGSVKFDGACGDRDQPKTGALRRLLQVTSTDRVWIAGSTQAPEEDIVLAVYRRLREQHPELRLFLVPRQRDRFDEVARLLERSGMPFRRRSTLSESDARSTPAVVLVDTIGELGALWGLADIAFVGGSLDGKRGGQNMIEPAAYGAAVLFGPHVWNFRDTADRLVQAGGAVQIPDAAALEREVARLLADPQARARLGRAAQQFVQSQQGATERTLTLLDGLLRAGQHTRTSSNHDALPRVA